MKKTLSSASFVAVVIIICLLFSFKQVEAVFAPPPLDQPYYSRTMMDPDYVAGPTYGYDFSSGYLGTGNNWSEASASGYTLKAQYHIDDSFNNEGGLQPATNAGSEFVQQFIATGDNPQFDVAWTGTMSFESGPGDMDLWYQLSWNYAIYDPGEDAWYWQNPLGSYDLDYIILHAGESQTINKTDSIALELSSGTKFALWIFQGTGATWLNDPSHAGQAVKLDSDFYNSFTITNISHAEVVPIPGAVWLLGSGLLGLVVVRRRKR